MLYAQSQRISTSLGAENGGTHSAPQISRGRPHGCGRIDRPQVRHDHSAHRSATLALCRRASAEKADAQTDRYHSIRIEESHIFLQYFQD
jgi:hypothetical protein